MKKLIAMLLALVLVMGLVACGATEETNNTTAGTTAGTTEAAGETTEGTVATTEDVLNAEDENAATEPVETTPVVEPNAASVVLSTIWAQFPEDIRPYFMGGDWNTPVEGDAGNYSLEGAEAAEAATAELMIPADQIANVTVASAIRHPMMANNFTCGLYQVSGDAAAFAEAMKAALTSAQWICGQPDKVIVAVIDGEYVLACFGINDNITPFEAALTAAYADAEIICNEAVAG